ncbi:NUDIX hydrolase [Aspergillus stella-maris]|uniref:NUDIX hydrolase n=1 Tax=Aspergillus stella-maris TaxID=1810926 RepID=UPI003CCE0AA6
MRRAHLTCALRPNCNYNRCRNLTSTSASFTVISSSFSTPRHRHLQLHQRHLSHSAPTPARSISSENSGPNRADMPRLNPASLAAINRLKAFNPPPSSYDLVPLERRAAVLLLLYADAQGDLRVVLTIRASTLSSYAGQAALPGGKADTLHETPLQTSRREASEEIGLPNLNSPLPSPFTVEHLCEIPCSLARTELVVRPVVALLHSHDEKTGKDADPETELIPRLDAREVAAVFTAPFGGFLERFWEGDESWYSGVWTEWWGTQWRMHQFHVPIQPSKVIKPRAHDTDQQESIDALKKQEEKTQGSEQIRYRVFGMTARILVDVARIAYDKQPDFEHNAHAGDEELISTLRGRGRLGVKEKTKI